ncbi:MAG: DUF721 domain-containing protein [Chloroherpetonaceae bacterium]|nr:DUF721 domain-containing protein [Chloroherpetonaceae bacterium]
MSYRNQPKPVSTVLDKVYHDLLSEQNADEFYALKNWSKVVGVHIAKVSEVEKLVGGTLFVKVKSAAWRNELIFKKAGIIEQINTKVGREVVKEIHFK